MSQRVTVRIKPGGWIAIAIAASITAWSYRSVIVATASSVSTSVRVARAFNSNEFGHITTTDPALATAIHATALDEAGKLINQEGAITGRVYKIFAQTSGSVHILNFDQKDNRAVSAIIEDKDAKSFPDLKTLVGERVLVRGKFVDFNGHPQIKITFPSQIAFVSVEQPDTKVAVR